VGQHRSASASRLLGLDGLRSSPPVVAGGEWRLAVQTTATAVDFRGRGARAELHGRRTVRVRDLPSWRLSGGAAWRKRIWRCREPAYGVGTWAGGRPRSVPGRC
jgi:hypothetical protein